MLENKKIAVVIPAYNEQLLIAETISSIPDYVDNIIVVNDASSDKTSEVIDAVTRKGLICLTHDKNVGVGGAIVTGYKKAISLNAQITVVMAGDAQMHPEDLRAVISPVLENRANYAKGNRFIQRNGFSQMPRLRVVGNFCFSIMSCIASGYYHIFDTQCGYTAIDRSTLLLLDLDSLYSRYGFPTDILAKLNKVSAKVIDVPVRAVYNTETSGISPFSYTMTIIFLTIKLFLERQLRKVRLKRPIIQDC